jgi:hypothetical protein
VTVFRSDTTAILHWSSLGTSRDSAFSYRQWCPVAKVIWTVLLSMLNRIHGNFGLNVCYAHLAMFSKKMTEIHFELTPIFTHLQCVAEAFTGLASRYLIFDCFFKF